MKFTDRYLKRLEPAAKRYSKTEDGGLTIRVNPSGQKSWQETSASSTARWCPASESTSGPRWRPRTG